MARQQSEQNRPAMLTLIAVTKLVKTVVLLVAGVAALAMIKADLLLVLSQWADAISIGTSTRALHRAVASLWGVSSQKLEEVGVGTFVYAGLFATEGVGLWLQKRWAEYFTIGITGSFIPLEIYEIARHATLPKVVTLVTNALVLAYLLVRVIRERPQSHSRKRRSWKFRSFGNPSTPSSSK